jgi:histidyl-tRNA synthetase
VVDLTARLRKAGVVADFSPKIGNVGKLLKDANRRGARHAVIVRPDKLSIKDLASGEQTDVPPEELLRDPRRFLA